MRKTKLVSMLAAAAGIVSCVNQTATPTSRESTATDATIPLADSVLLPLGRTYVHNVYDGAGHGFLRQQSGMGGANLTASRQAWPATIAWFRKYLRS